MYMKLAIDKELTALHHHDLLAGCRDSDIILPRLGIGRSAYERIFVERRSGFTETSIVPCGLER